MNQLEIPISDPRNPAIQRSVPGLRLSAITETVDLVEGLDGSAVRLRKARFLFYIIFEELKTFGLYREIYTKRKCNSRRSLTE